MEKFIFISDPHICAGGERIIGLDPAQRLREVLETATTDHPDAKAVIFLGDLTHHGATHEYENLRDLLAALTVPVILMLGNHDRRAPFLSVFADVPQTAGGFVQDVNDFERIRLITLDSLDGPPYPDNHHSGRLCAQRLAFLQEALETRGDKTAVVCIHHPPFDTGIRGMDNIRLQDAPAFLSMLAPYSDLYLVCGHVHRNISGMTAGIPWTMFKSPCHQGVLDLETDNAHLSTNEPAAYGLMLVTDEGIVLHSVDVNLSGVRIFGGYAPEEQP